MRIRHRNDSDGPQTTVQRTGTWGQFVPKYSGFGELPNKHFCGPCALQKFRSVATPELLAKTHNPQHGAKKRRLRFLLRFLRFFRCFHRLDCGFNDFQFSFVQGVQHGINPLSTLAPAVLEYVIVHLIKDVLEVLRIEGGKFEVVGLLGFCGCCGLTGLFVTFSFTVTVIVFSVIAPFLSTTRKVT